MQHFISEFWLKKAFRAILSLEYCIYSCVIMLYILVHKLLSNQKSLNLISATQSDSTIGGWLMHLAVIFNNAKSYKDWVNKISLPQTCVLSSCNMTDIPGRCLSFICRDWVCLFRASPCLDALASIKKHFPTNIRCKISSHNALRDLNMHMDWFAEGFNTFGNFLKLIYCRVYRGLCLSKEQCSTLHLFCIFAFHEYAVLGIST